MRPRRGRITAACRTAWPRATALPQAVKRQVKKESGTTCEHGVWKCRICNPVVKHK
jgi:hypothetical protein